MLCLMCLKFSDCKNLEDNNNETCPNFFHFPYQYKNKIYNQIIYNFQNYYF